jgi:transcriptional regulator with XRE-family HTH domain
MVCHERLKVSDDIDKDVSLAGLLKEAIRGRSVRRVEIMTGVAKSTVSKLLNGGMTTARTLEDLAHGLNIPVKPLLDAAGLAPTGRRVGDRGPFLDAWGVEVDAAPLAMALRDVRAVGAGSMRLVEAEAPGEDLASVVGPLRAWKIIGDCMAPVLLEGDEILVAPAESAIDGSVVVAAVDLFYVTCKRLRIQGAKSWLEPINGEERIEESRFEVVGVVHRVLRAPGSFFPERRVG